MIKIYWLVHEKMREYGRIRTQDQKRTTVHVRRYNHLATKTQLKEGSKFVDRISLGGGVMITPCHVE